MDINNIKYSCGFNNYHQTEAEPGTLPKNQNSPQIAPMGLYAEQLNGSAFTTPRDHTKFSWCYKTTPSVIHPPFELYKNKSSLNNVNWLTPPFNNSKPQSPNQLRWSPDTLNNNIKLNFIDSIKTIAGFGSPTNLSGAAVHSFICNTNMSNTNNSNNNIYFSSNDSDLLIVMQSGSALFTTEFGLLDVTSDHKNSEIIVIPRGIKFKVDLLSDYISGYICENFGAPFTLPELGPIGANGLANPRHFLYPTAYYESSKYLNNISNTYTWICKYQGNLWQTNLQNSPCNIVAWHGNYAPYKYDLNLYNTINTVSYDHPDPSIFTVLTSPSSFGSNNGIANIDFVIFPSRWMVAENTFRPPYFHRNIMSEFMGLIKGEYDAKMSNLNIDLNSDNNSFKPGGYSIHNRMAPHGPDYESVLKAESSDLKPQRYNNTLAFMFESNMAWDVTDSALESNKLQKDYYKCWQDIPERFNQ